jgi:hypothetical protein
MKQFHQMSCRDLSPAERQFLTILQRQKDVESRVAVENEFVTCLNKHLLSVFGPS